MDYKRIISWMVVLHSCLACTFYSSKDFPSDAESGKFIRIKENHAVGDEIMTLDVYPRKSIVLRGMERTTDDKYFRIKELNATTIQILLTKSLNDLVDSDAPQNILKFKLQCVSLVSNNRNDDMSYLTVTVYIEDINDNKPIFQNTPYAISIDENIPQGSIVFQGVQAFDRDKPNTPNSDIQYFISHQTTDSLGPYFTFESPHRPQVILKRPLDFDDGIRQFDIMIIASDRGTPQQQSNTTLTIFVEDVDDLPPIFSQEAYYTKVKEFFTITGKTIHKALKVEPPVRAFDQDSLNASLHYSITAGNDKGIFWINQNTGVLFLKKEIDLEELNLQGNTFLLQIEARQKNDNLKRTSTRLEIEIIDINDNLPEFEVDLYNISIVENLPTGFSVLQVNAIDRDQGENAEFYYKVFKEDPIGAFVVDSRTGWMTVKNQTLLDREERSSVKLLIQAVEKAKPYDRRAGAVPETATVAVEITLLDANDNTPTFEMGNLYEFKVDVNSSFGHMVGRIRAIDPDQGANGQITYEIKNRKESSFVPFKLDPKTGVLTVVGKLQRGRIALFVEASDNPINPSERRYSLAVLTLDIINKNENNEIKFMGSPYEFWIGSNSPIGASVGQVRTVFNSDVHDDIIYDLLHSYPEGVPFAIEELSGIITVIRPISNFNKQRFSFEAIATYAHSPVEHVQNQTRQVRKQTPESMGFQVDEGIVSDLNYANMYVANVTINVVNPNSKEKIFMRGAHNQIIEFHIRENQANTLIGNLLSSNLTDNDKIPSLSHQRRPTISRENRQLMTSSKFRKPMEAKKPHEPLAITSNASNVTHIIESETDPVIVAGSTNRKSKTLVVERNNTLRKKSFSQQYGRVYNLPPITFKKNITTRRPSNYTKAVKKFSNKSRFQRATNNDLGFFIANDHDVKDKIFVTNDGRLMTIGGLDREEADFYKLSVIAEYTTGQVASAGIYQINIIVDDENDNSPLFDHSTYVGIAPENSALGTEIMINNPIIVTDLDIGRNADFNISIHGDGSRLFTIEKSTARTGLRNKRNSTLLTDAMLDEYSDMIDNSLMNLHLMFMSTDDMPSNKTNYIIKFIGPAILDRERKNYYKLKMVATDSAGLSSEAQLIIFVTDLNDNAPQFEKLAVYKNTGIEILQYTDKMEIYFVDKNQLIETSNTSDSNTRTTMKARNDFTRYNIRERFASTESPTRPMTSRSPVRIKYRKNPIGSPRNLDQDSEEEVLARAYRDNSRQNSSSSKYPLFVLEESVPPGTTILQFTATDDDYGSNALVTYEIASETVEVMKNLHKNISLPHNFFSIDRISGELKVNRMLIPQLEIRLSIVAKDSAELKDTVIIAIKISDVNNFAPEFKRPFYSFDIEEGFHISKILGTIEAYDQDYEDNANVTYSIMAVEGFKMPFSVTPTTGIVKVSGELDREQKSLYEFKILASDNSLRYGKLNSSVEIEINIIDKNDNFPQFIGYDDLMINDLPNEQDYSRSSSASERKLAQEDFEDGLLVKQNRTPVYKITLDRHVRPRRFIKQIQAIDIDFAGNGNGLVMYGIKHSNVSYLFDIDVREGVITTTTSPEHLKVLNQYDFLNLTIVASDLGNAVKTSYALLLINLEGEKNETKPDPTTAEPYTTTNIPAYSNPKSLFNNKYYELEILENNEIPIKLMQINTTNDNFIYKWSIAQEDGGTAYGDMFNVDDGVLWLLKSLDREENDLYKLHIKAELVNKSPRGGRRKGKTLQMMYPITDDRIENLQENEIRVVIKVLDDNDHSPVFEDEGQPIIAVIPDSASYGYNVIKLRADDEDIGLNSEIRYSLMNEATNLFGIDSISGQVRTLGPLWRSNQKLYGLDVKATDRQGSDSGKSAIVNVLVYVLEENKHVRYVLAGNALDIEREIETIAKSLSDASGLNIKVRMIEPNMDNVETMTNLYIYAIDPKTNSLVEMEELQEIMANLNREDFQPSLPIVELAKFGSISHIAYSKPPKSGGSNNPNLHGSELASIVLSITIFVGGLATACCIICVRYKRRAQNSISPLPHNMHRHIYQTQQPSLKLDYSTSHTTETSCDENLASKNHIYAPVRKMAKPQRDEREYIDIPLPQSVLANLQQQQNHESSCSRYNFILHDKNNIIKEQYESNDCVCRPEGDESSSYDDSLKDFPLEETTMSTTVSLSHEQQAQQQRLIARQQILENLDRGLNRHSFSGSSFQIARMQNSHRSFVLNKNNGN